MLPNFSQYIGGALPKDQQFEVLHLQSIPVESHPIITAPYGITDLSSLTIKTQHFFTFFKDERTIFGFEVYVYILLKKDNPTESERLLFISKADTTGYINSKISIKQLTKRIISYLLSIDPNHYLQKVIPLKRNYGSQKDSMITKSTSTLQSLHLLALRNSMNSTYLKPYVDDNQIHFLSFRCPSNIVTKISLFTRPSPQYLFSKSSNNPNKHVLNGFDLMKWWINIIDDTIIENFQSNTIAKLLIPGEDYNSISRNLSNLKYVNWNVGTIFGQNREDLAVYSVPLFPDDPKSRFLHHLVADSRAKSTNLETFWTELQGRQEFCSGETVSVIGISGILNYQQYYNPDPNEIVIPSSKKQFEYIKSYITGEEYDTEEGAFESYMNIRDFVTDRLNASLIEIIGSREFNSTNSGSLQNLQASGDTDYQRKHSTEITTLQPRKKQKKNY
ncbi:hypothetical protein TBLA_0H02870 [Henningerozyma blattae CBS 6284]|uniref:histone acetyltransferase n=1 Tax=Henningerozyma blattae (strain ATCC 34711 / CBS 6284 / DSM 70876 / NBRC 10599 / NRRL Y-10934 / UCD 77-7) TaxID=1071380 RepID=I2H869_HENB6|nr:hypothetical protein TBLA_0H02870 [Tetrapisispora blattae CBS 6284]CCH62571.1 hypothetical protein TBLA_0H02870 [Tetrapisispora blattae CBS 6284]